MRPGTDPVLAADVSRVDIVGRPAAVPALLRAFEHQALVVAQADVVHLQGVKSMFWMWQQTTIKRPANRMNEACWHKNMTMSRRHALAVP